MPAFGFETNLSPFKAYVLISYTFNRLDGTPVDESQRVKTVYNIVQQPKTDMIKEEESISNDHILWIRLIILFLAITDM